MNANSASAAALRSAPASRIVCEAVAMPSARACVPTKSSQKARCGCHSARIGARVATGSSWKLAPLAVIISTPSVTSCSAASGKPRPPMKEAASRAESPSAIQARQ
jgi:hypothetical protein